MCDDPPHRQRSLILIVSTLHAPLPKNPGRSTDHNLAVVERSIVKQRTREHTFLQCRGEYQRGKRSTRRALRLERAVVFALSEIAPAHQSQNAAGAIVDSDN